MGLTSRIAATALLAAAAGAARAHDTWFEPLPSTPGGHAVFALGTGTRFPTYEFALAYESIAASGCRGEGATAAPLAHVEDRPTAVVVRSATPLNARSAITCWAQVVPFDVEVPPDKIELYLREIQASPALRATWEGMKSRGLPWRERYTKFARIELAARARARHCRWPWTCARQPAPADPRRRRTRIPGVSRWQADRRPAGRAGRQPEPARHLAQDRRRRPRPRTVPLAGRWILRGVDLRVSSQTSDEWVSWFVVLGFEVSPAER